MSNKIIDIHENMLKTERLEQSVLFLALLPQIFYHKDIFDVHYTSNLDHITYILQVFKASRSFFHLPLDDTDHFAHHSLCNSY